MGIETVGWDVGGAHLKGVALDADGTVVEVFQRPCPLWQGLAMLTRSLSELGKQLPAGGHVMHAVTMTGELADVFPDRRTGVSALIQIMRASLGSRVLIFAGPSGLLELDAIHGSCLDRVASANWLASGLAVAKKCDCGLLVDVGSTTTDLISFANGEVLARGYTDEQRLRYDELVYQGLLRTPVMAIADRAPFQGHWIALMNESFATATDVYRISGELSEYTDQFPSADGGTKDVDGSARRLARMIGRDVESADLDEWVGLARFFRECQLGRICSAVSLQLSRTVLAPHAPLIGAGIGRFLVQTLAARLGRGYIDAQELFSAHPAVSSFSVADCLPAVAVAHLARYR